VLTKYDIFVFIIVLIDNIIVQFNGIVYQQMIGIPMGTKCAPQFTDLFLLACRFTNVVDDRKIDLYQPEVVF
jgi:hypothetical protein